MKTQTTDLRLTSLKRAVLGSTSDYLARNCPCPVMIVKVTQEDIERRKHWSETKLSAFESLIRKSSLARSRISTARYPPNAHLHHAHRINARKIM